MRIPNAECDASRLLRTPIADRTDDGRPAGGLKKSGKYLQQNKVVQIMYIIVVC